MEFERKLAEDQGKREKDQDIKVKLLKLDITKFQGN